MFEDEMFLSCEGNMLSDFLKTSNPLFEMNIFNQKHKGLIFSKTSFVLTLIPN